jgi:hypothetical protein
MNKEKLRTYAIYCSTAADAMKMKEVLITAGEYVFNRDTTQHGPIPCHLRYTYGYWLMCQPERQRTTPSPIINFSDLVKDKS